MPFIGEFENFVEIDGMRKRTKTQKTILMISPEPWTTLAVSKHHYARALCACGHHVLFLNPPRTSGDGLAINPVPDQPGLFTVDAPPVMYGLRHMPRWLRVRLETQWLERLEGKFGTVIDTVWLFENSRFYDMDFAGDRLRIYHQVDVNQDFHIAAAASSAHICICTSEAIARRLRAHARHVVKIDHGYAEPPSNIRLPADMKARFNRSGPHLVYIGNLDIRYLRADLLQQAVTQFSGAVFHFVGSYSEATPLFQATRDLLNVIWWGAIDSSLIPEVLTHADVLLLAYDSENWPDQLSNPHKLMQYLGSGKVTVATWTQEYADKRHLLEMVTQSTDFVTHLGSTLANLAQLNSPKKVAERIAFARGHSYSRQLVQIEAALAQIDRSLNGTETT